MKRKIIAFLTLRLWPIEFLFMNSGNTSSDSIKRGKRNVYIKMTVVFQMCDNITHYQARDNFKKQPCWRESCDLGRLRMCFWCRFMEPKSAFWLLYLCMLLIKMKDTSSIHLDLCLFSNENENENEKRVMLRSFKHTWKFLIMTSLYYIFFTHSICFKSIS
jgi:hypothetical protein